MIYNHQYISIDILLMDISWMLLDVLFTLYGLNNIKTPWIEP